MDLLEQATAFILSFVISISGAVTSVLPSQTPQPSQEPLNVITRSGHYSYAGQTLKYTVNLPKDGGKVTGKLSGVCSGPIEGDFNAGPAQVAEGKASATCPILLNKTFTVSYTAHFVLNEGRAHINWQGDLPYTPGLGTFTINFEPSI